MGTIILQCCDPSIPFKKKILSLQENKPFRIGSLRKNEAGSNYTSLFACPGDFMSYYHAHFILHGNKFYLENRSIGTYINNKSVNEFEKTEIFTGNVIRLGEIRCAGECFAFKIILSVDKDDSKYIKLLEEEFPLQINLYTDRPPMEELNISYIYDSFCQRLEVLQLFDRLGGFEINKNTNFGDIMNKIKAEGYIDFYKLITRDFSSLEEEYNLRKMDNISYFTAFIGFSSSVFLRKWFVNHETKFVYLKWMYLNDIEKYEILIMYDIPYRGVSMPEKVELIEKKYHMFVDPISDMFKINFAHVSSALRGRDYLLLNGYVYMTIDLLILAVINRFEQLNMERLCEINKNIHKISDEERIMNVIKYVEKKIKPNNKYDRSSRKITPDMVDEMAKESFPLCMNILNFYLNKNHHLRNGGRYQYGLFLKGIGMSLSHSLAFWRNHFAKLMTVYHFDKHYSYHIRHSYGAVGRMYDYPPLKCSYILETTPNPLDYHGCPFKTLNKERIFYELQRNQIIGEDAKKIWAIMKSGFPQLACTEYFNIRHKSSEPLIEHPNEFFDKSVKIHNKETKENANAVKTSTTLLSCKPCCSKSLDW